MTSPSSPLHSPDDFFERDVDEAHGAERPRTERPWTEPAADADVFSRCARARLAMVAALLGTAGCTASEEEEAFHEQAAELTNAFRCGRADREDTVLPDNLILEDGDPGVVVVDFSDLDATEDPTLAVTATGEWSLRWIEVHELGALDFSFSVDPSHVTTREDEESRTLEIPVSERLEIEDGTRVRMTATVTLIFFNAPGEGEADTWLNVTSPILIGNLDMGLWTPPPFDTSEPVRGGGGTGTAPSQTTRCQRFFGL